MYKILKHCTLEKITLTVLKEHLCSFLFVILNSNFFSIMQELKISMDMNFISLVLFFRFKRHTKKIYSDWKAGIYSLPFFIMKRNAMIMHWSIIHLRGKLQYPLYGICRVRAVSRMLKIEPVVLNQEQLL